MTHDELLQRIAIVGDTSIEEALRAAVELHKPSQSYLFDDEVCDSCSSEEDRSEIFYPCKTIRTIEKELK
jgi:hypothetical protein